MIQPFLCDLHTGTFLHRLLDKVTGHIGKQTIYPYADLFLVLFLKLSLTVDRPAQQPAGILTAYDTARDGSSASRITLTDLFNIRKDLVIQRCDRCRFPVRLGDIRAELLRVSKGRILLCNILPEIPAAAGTNLRISVRCMVLVSVNGSLGTASVCDKDQIILCQDNALFNALHLAFDRLGYLASILDLEDYICHLCVELKLYSRILQILFHRKDQGLILVISCEFQGTEIRQSRNMVDKSLEVKLHLQCAVPVFKGKHGSPVQPEGRLKYLIVKHILDGLVVQILILCHEQLHDLHAALLAQVEFTVCMGILATVHRRPAQGVVRIFLVEPVILIQHGSSRYLR